MSDYPLLDPRADDLLNADCGTIGQIAGMFKMIAGQAEVCSSTLTAAAHGVTWMGSANDSFQSSISSFTPKLTAIHSAYTDAGAAVQSYHDTVSDVQPKFKQLKEELLAAEQKYNSLNAAYQSAQSTADADRDSLIMPGTNLLDAKTIKQMGKTYRNAETTASNDYTAVQNQNTELEQLRARGMSLLEEFSTARGHAQSKIGAVGAKAPKESGWDKLFHVIEDVGGFFAGIGKGIYDDITSIPDDVENMIKHPDLDNLAKLAEDTGVAAATAAALLTGAGALADGALAAAIDVAGDAAEVAGTASTATSIATEVAQGKDGDALIDLAFMGIPDADEVIPGMVSDSEVKAAESVAGATDKYATALEHGMTPKQAMASLNEADQKLLQSAPSVPINASTARADADAAETNATQLKAKLPTSQAANYATEQAGKEPLKDKDKDAVNTVAPGLNRAPALAH